MTVPDTATHPNYAAKLRALLIPADVHKEIEPLAIGGEDGCLKDLQVLVGGSIETFPYPDRTDVAPYFNEEGKILELAPNGRATRLLASVLDPRDHIAGDCVLAGFDIDTGETVDLPSDFELSIPPSPARANPGVRRRERTIIYEWEVATSGNGARTFATLTISHRRAGTNVFSGEPHPNEFYAVFANETVHAVEGGAIRGFQAFTGIGVLHRPVSRFSAAGLEAFADQALAHLRMLVDAGEPKVTHYFTSPRVVA